MSAGTPERLAYMANQIAANLALADDPVAATAEHIHSFWTRAMQRTLVSDALDRLGPIARAAIEQFGDRLLEDERQLWNELLELVLGADRPHLALAAVGEAIEAELAEAREAA